MKVDYILIDFNENYDSDSDTYFDKYNKIDRTILFEIIIVSGKYKIDFHSIGVNCEIDYDYDYDETTITKVDKKFLMNLYNVLTDEKYALLYFKDRELSVYAKMKINLFKDDKIVFHEKFLEMIED